jgi:hypothetical protein
MVPVAVPVGESLDEPTAIDRNNDEAAPIPPGTLTYLLSYATEPHSISQGYLFEGDASSPYSRALDESLSRPGTDLNDALYDVRDKVAFNTKGSQVPNHDPRGAGRPQFYFQATSEDVRRAREQWLAALRSRDPKSVDSFISRNGSSPYIRAAIRWLEDERERQ